MCRFSPLAPLLRLCLSGIPSHRILRTAALATRLWGTCAVRLDRTFHRDHDRWSWFSPSSSCAPSATHAFTTTSLLAKCSTSWPCIRLGTCRSGTNTGSLAPNASALSAINRRCRAAPRGLESGATINSPPLSVTVTGRRPGVAVRHYNRASPMTSRVPIESGARL
jgi:hypothetical protein